MVTEEQESSGGLASESIPVPQASNSLQRPCEEMLNQEGNVSRQKPRLRKRALNALILKQMEFYFSDANLSKDRFLGALIKSDPYVDLNVFLCFNKIKVLTDDVHRVAKALKSSTILSLNEDGTKVCRTTPINSRDDCEACTVYVQGLPPDANHEWLSNLFSRYGVIAYISVPRYKSNRKIKGFAFIEFDTVEGANKCLKAFQEKHCTLPSHTAPHELLSITTFTEDEQSSEMMLSSEQAPQTGESSTVKKRKAENIGSGNDSSEDDAKKSKKICVEDSVKKERITVKEEYIPIKEENIPIKEENIPIKEEYIPIKEENIPIKDEYIPIKEECQDKTETDTFGKSIVVNSANEVSQSEEEGVKDDGAVEVAKKKKRKRKRPSRSEQLDVADLGLHIMAKKDWKQLRNKYLQLQRNKMKELKQHLRKPRWNQCNSNYDRKIRMETEEVDKKDSKEKIETSSPKFNFTPGVIVKIEFDEPCSNPKSFKLELRGDTAVKYIDVQESSSKAYVRFDNAEAAKGFVNKYSEEKILNILEGKEEKAYWDKMSQDREEKLSKKDRVKQRGRDKLLKKAEKELGKHIKFDEV